MRARRCVAMVAVSAFGVIGVSCGSATAPPYGLQSIDLPEGRVDIETVFSEMPDALEGHAANEATGEEHMVRLSYGSEHDVAIAATDWGLGEGDSPPWTNEEMLPRFARSGEVDVAESVLTGPLLWLTGENHTLNEQGEILTTFWTMWFGAPSSHWTFSVSATSEQEGVALVEAFVEAAS